MAIVVPVLLIAVVGMILLGAAVYFIDKNADHRNHL
jgi:hypothetical protein